MKKEEHKEGSQASQGMLDAIDNAPAGSVYVMVLEDGADYAGIGGLMATAMKYRGLAGAVIDGGGARYAADPQAAVPGVQPRRGAFHHHQPLPLRRRQHSGDLRRRARESRRHHRGRRRRRRGGAARQGGRGAQEGPGLDDTEHRMLPFIEKFRSIKEAVPSSAGFSAIFRA